MAEEYTKNLPQKHLVKTSTTPVEACELENEALAETIVTEKPVGNYTIASSFDTGNIKTNNLYTGIDLKDAYKPVSDNLSNVVSVT